jgi:hypothetical protein
VKEDGVKNEMKAGNILIQEGILLPEALQIEREPCVPGCRFVRDLDGYGLDREIQKTGWTFFCLAGEINATVFGNDRQKKVRRAIEQILTNPRSKEFNSLQITRVVSKRFLGVPYISVSAVLRHIQKSMVLFSDEESQPGLTRLTAVRTRVRGLTSAHGLTLEGTNGQTSAAMAASL